jgi:glycosyltransferase involved in cell wall biosynthesis
MARKIKVLHILPSLTRGGAEKVCFDIISNLNLDKFEPTLLLFKDNGEGLAWKKSLENHNVSIYKLNKKKRVDLPNFVQIIKIIKKIKPDIIHTHLGGDIYGRLAGKLAGVKVIVSTEHNINQSETKLVSLLKRWTVRYAKQIFAVSQAVKEDAVTRYLIKSAKITVIYNGIDIGNFSNCYKETEDNEIITLGAMGRLSRQKGFSVLIESIKLVKSKNIRLLIAGQGELEINLKKQVNRLNLNDKIKFLGKIDPQNFFKQIDVFVFPSLWEGLGLVALEAAASKKPIIASSVDGIREIITDESGWLFQSGNEHDLAKKIEEVTFNINNQETKNKIEKAFNIVSHRFSLDKMVFNYSVWYEKLLS